MNRYSELISDNMILYTEAGKTLPDGVSVVKHYKYGVEVERYEIRSIDTSKKLGLPKGRYTLLTLPNVIGVDKDVQAYYIDKVYSLLSKYLPNDCTSIMVVGLGNRHMVADSLGAKVVGRIDIVDSPHFRSYAIAPSVMGLTGIESSDIVDAVYSKVKPDYIIVIDSLCASNTSRLGSSFQLCDYAFAPGSGVGNRRRAVHINKSISIGVPLVVYSSTFIRQTLHDMGIVSKIDSNDNVVVTPSNIDSVVDASARIISGAINKYIRYKLSEKN